MKKFSVRPSRKFLYKTVEKIGIVMKVLGKVRNLDVAAVFFDVAADVIVEASAHLNFFGT